MLFTTKNRKRLEGLTWQILEGRFSSPKPKGNARERSKKNPERPPEKKG